MKDQQQHTRIAVGGTTHLAFPIAIVMAGMATPRPEATCQDLYHDYRMSLDLALAALAAGNVTAYDRHFKSANALGRKGFSQLCFWARD